MKFVVTIVAAGCLMLAGCTTQSEIQPIPGSITYGGQPRTKLTKSPVGSIVPHEFYNQQGNLVRETYIVQPDRSLRLASQQVVTEQEPRL